MNYADSNVGGDDVASSENPAKKPHEKLSFGNKYMQEDLGMYVLIIFGKQEVWILQNWKEPNNWSTLSSGFLDGWQV